MPLRPLIRQEATAFQFTVPVAPAASPAPQLSLNSLIDSFLITVPTTAANSVFLGFDAGVIVGTGIELLAGSSVPFRIDQDGRQLYELQHLLMKMAQQIGCTVPEIQEEIPFVCWDMSQIYLVAAAATVITMCIFKAVYI